MVGVEQINPTKYLEINLSATDGKADPYMHIVP